MMELLGVFAALIAMLATLAYVTIAPTVLNLALASGVAWWGRHRGGCFAALITFVVVAFLATLGGRLPDIVRDLVAGLGASESITRTLVLPPGALVEVGSPREPLAHRRAYFETVAFKAPGFMGRLVAPQTFPEDVLRMLRDRGLRLGYGPADPDGVRVRIDADRDATHQSVAVEVFEGAESIARFSSRERVRFAQEIGASRARLHRMHLFENTIWNLLLVVFESPRVYPVSEFLDRVIRVEGARPEPEYAVVDPAIERVELDGFDADDARARLNVFDCDRAGAPQVEVSGLRQTVRASDHELVVDWPRTGLDGLSLTAWNRLKIARIACGEQGFLVLLAGEGERMRVLLVDRLWQARAGLDFSVPELSTERLARYRHLIEFRQQGDQIHLAAIMRGAYRADRTREISHVRVIITDPRLDRDYGGSASRPVRR